MKKSFTLLVLIITILAAHSQNVGIGTNTPAYKLDVAGRLRLQSTSGTAGIWLDGTSTQARSFIGTINEDHVGIYGNGGIGWGFAMNVNNGNIGIGTSAPTAVLDINGDLRIRGSSPKKGSTLTSIDVNGNAQWTEAIAFKVTGGYNGSATGIPEQTWTKVFFNQTVSYNVGLAFQPINSQFIVPEKGIYHFDGQLNWESTAMDHSVRIRVNRGGNFFQELRIMNTETSTMPATYY